MKLVRRSPSLNTVNGVLINNDQIQTTNLSPSRQNKNNRVMLPPSHLTSSSSSKSYVNLLQKKLQKSSKKSNSKLSILNTSNTNNNSRKSNLKTGQNAETVKLWLFKSIVHVKPQNSNGNGNRNTSGIINANTKDQTNLRVNTANKTTNYSNNQETIMSEIELNCNADSSINNVGGNMIASGNGNSSSEHGNIEIKEDKNGVPDITTYTFCRHAIRSTYMDKSIEAKKKVIRMLFVIIVEFFVCWAPIHILNTVYLFSPAFVYHHVSSTGIALVQLMAYISSCCNPITYCFMNRRFRQAFMAIFNCYKCRRCCSKTPEIGEGPNSIGRHELIAGIPCNSDASGNDSIVYIGRTNGLNRSVVTSVSSNRIAQVIETDPDDASFRYRITWSRPCTSGANCKTGPCCTSDQLYS